MEKMTFLDKDEKTIVEWGGGPLWVKFPFKWDFPTAVIFSALVYFVACFEKYFLPNLINTKTIPN